MAQQTRNGRNTRDAVLVTYEPGSSLATDAEVHVGHRKHLPGSAERITFDRAVRVEFRDEHGVTWEQEVPADVAVPARPAFTHVTLHEVF